MRALKFIRSHSICSKKLLMTHHQGTKLLYQEYGTLETQQEQALIEERENQLQKLEDYDNWHNGTIDKTCG